MTLTAVERRPRHALISAPDIELVDPALYLAIPNTEALHIITGIERTKTRRIGIRRRSRYRRTSAPIEAVQHIALQYDGPVWPKMRTGFFTWSRFEQAATAMAVTLAAGASLLLGYAIQNGMLPL